VCEKYLHASALDLRRLVSTWSAACPIEKSDEEKDFYHFISAFSGIATAVVQLREHE
jgi:hypothetical protein